MCDQGTAVKSRVKGLYGSLMPRPDCMPYFRNIKLDLRAGPASPYHSSGHYHLKEIVNKITSTL